MFKKNVSIQKKLISFLNSDTQIKFLSQISPRPNINPNILIQRPLELEAQQQPQQLTAQAENEPVQKNTIIRKLSAFGSFVGSIVGPIGTVIGTLLFGGFGYLIKKIACIRKDVKSEPMNSDHNHNAAVLGALVGGATATALGATIFSSTTFAWATTIISALGLSSLGIPPLGAVIGIGVVGTLLLSGLCGLTGALIGAIHKKLTKPKNTNINSN